MTRFCMDQQLLECRLIRCMGHMKCVIQLNSTGAIIPITLTHQLNPACSPHVTVLKPVDAKVLLGKFTVDWFEDCELRDIAWPAQPPPHSFPPQRLHKRKRKQ